MLPMEITRTGNLSYDKAMFAGLEYLDEVRMDAMRSSLGSKGKGDKSLTRIVCTLLNSFLNK